MMKLNDAYKEARSMRMSSLGHAGQAIERVLELSADAQITSRRTPKGSPAFHSLQGAIAAYGKTLAIHCHLRFLEYPLETLTGSVDAREARYCHSVCGFFRTPRPAVLGAERPTPLMADHSRSEDAVKGDHREPHERACPLTAVRAKGSHGPRRKGRLRTAVAN
jgi:hypothetical protein